MKILKLKAENFKRLKVVEITPDGNIVNINGRNDQGKSSVLDAIHAALIGGKSGITTPINRESEKAKIQIKFDDFCLTRTFTKSGSYLKIENNEGFEKKSPQKFMDEIVGHISFDPMLFYRKKPAEQKKVLLSICGYDIESSELKKAEKYKERTFLNREIKELENVIDSICVDESDCIEPVDVKAILKKVEVNGLAVRKRDEIINSIDSFKNDVLRNCNKINENIVLIEKLMDANKALEDQNKSIEENITGAKNESESMYVLSGDEIASLHNDIENAEKVNENIAKMNRVLELKKLSNEKTVIIKNLNDEMRNIDNEKESALQNFKFPISGISVDDNGLTFDGIPLNDCSTSTRIKVAVSISMMANPKLRVIRISDGSLLDSESLKIIYDVIKDNDYQLWIETVDDNNNTGFCIEDGEVK